MAMSAVVEGHPGSAGAGRRLRLWTIRCALDAVSDTASKTSRTIHERMSAITLAGPEFERKTAAW
jgi:hypothetical protein